MDDVAKALEQIAEIHGQLAKGEIYRGWRSIPVAASGAVGIAAALAQSRAARPLDAATAIWFWILVACTAALVGCGEIAWHYVRHATATERRRTRRVIAQFAPAIVTGAIVTLALMRIDPALARLLPGLWAIFFGLGIVSAQPYLPADARYVAWFYWSAGIGLLWFARDVGFSPWPIGGTFGAGQLISAAVIYWTLERHETTDSEEA